MGWGLLGFLLYKNLASVTHVHILRSIYTMRSESELGCVNEALKEILKVNLGQLISAT